MTLLWIVLILVGGFCVLVAYSAIVVGARSDRAVERAIESINFSRKTMEPIVGKGYDSQKLKRARNEPDELPEAPDTNEV